MSEVDINLILELVVVLLGVISALLGQKWRTAVKLAKKVPLVRKTFEEGADIFRKLEGIEDFSKLAKKDLEDLLKESQEFVASLKKVYEDP